jgi:hypothetical protein
VLAGPRWYSLNSESIGRRALTLVETAAGASIELAACIFTNGDNSLIPAGGMRARFADLPCHSL